MLLTNANQEPNQLFRSRKNSSLQKKKKNKQQTQQERYDVTFKK